MKRKRKGGEKKIKEMVRESMCESHRASTHLPRQHWQMDAILMTQDRTPSAPGRVPEEPCGSRTMLLDLSIQVKAVGWIFCGLI